MPASPPSLLRPPPLSPGDVIGVCTPSFPAHVRFREKYLHGLSEIERLGFRVREGSLTGRATAEGYRAGSPRARADELMELFLDPSVRAIVTTIGGSCSASLVPHLDFEAIRRHPKIFCGYSDVTSLHLALLAKAGLSTFYGPAVVPSFGDHPHVLPETAESFLAATSGAGERELVPPARFSRHVRNAATDAWKTDERRFEDNSGPFSLRPGLVEAPCVVANLATLCSNAGTDVFPDLTGRILFVEEMNAPLSVEERNLRHLSRLGVFGRIAALVVGKPEVYSNEGAPFEYPALVDEIVPPGLPVVMDFDCSHTMPMFTIAQETRLRLDAREHCARVFVLEPMVG